MAEAVLIYKILNFSFLDTASASLFKISSFFSKIIFCNFSCTSFLYFLISEIYGRPNGKDTKLLRKKTFVV